MSNTGDLAPSYGVLMGLLLGASLWCLIWSAVL